MRTNNNLAELESKSLEELIEEGSNADKNTYLDVVFPLNVSIIIDVELCEIAHP